MWYIGHTSRHGNNSSDQVGKTIKNYCVITLLITAMLSETTQLYALASSLSRKFLCTYNMKGTVHRRGPINGIIQNFYNNKWNKWWSEFKYQEGFLNHIYRESKKLDLWVLVYNAFLERLHHIFCLPMLGKYENS